MGNPWCEHVKNYCKTHGCSYREGLEKASASYKKKGGSFADDIMKITNTKKYENPATNVVGAAGSELKKSGLPGGKEFGSLLSLASDFIGSMPRDKISLPEMKRLARYKKSGNTKAYRKLRAKIKAR